MTLAKGYTSRVIKVLTNSPRHFKQQSRRLKGEYTEDMYKQLRKAVVKARDTMDDEDRLANINRRFARVKTIVESSKPLSPDGLVPWITIEDFTGLTPAQIPAKFRHLGEVKYLWGGRDTGKIVHQTLEVGSKYPAKGWTAPSTGMAVVVDAESNRADYWLDNGVLSKLKFYVIDHGEGKYTVDCKKNMTYEELTAVFDEAVADFRLKDGKNWTEIYKAFEPDVHSWYDILTEMHQANGGE